MATTTYHSITLPGRDALDWMTSLNLALARITEVMVRQQLPAGTTLRWGDIAGGKYLEATPSGVKVVGGLDLGTTSTSNLGVPKGDSFPVDTKAGDLFFRTDEETLYFRNAANDAWTALSGIDVVALEAAGVLTVVMLGAEKGSFMVSDGEGATENVAPGADRTVLTSLASEDSGWALATVLSLLGYALTKGQIAVGLGGDAAGALDVGANDSLLVADSGEAEGVKWVSLQDILGTILDEQGKLLAGSATGPVAVAVAAANNYVLVSDTTVASGVKWVPQNELGAIPNSRTRVAGDLYLYANYI